MSENGIMAFNLNSERLAFTVHVLFEGMFLCDATHIHFRRVFTSMVYTLMELAGTRGTVV